LELNKKRYILIRKIVKVVIILFWIFTFITPFLIFVSTYTNSIPIADDHAFICWRGSYDDFSPYPLYWLFFVLFLIGFFLSFGNVKTNYKNRIINRNMGNISGIIVLISGIGMYIFIQSIGSNILAHGTYETKIGRGVYLPIIIAILVFGETFFLNRVKIISVDIMNPKTISTKTYCPECGTEILDESKAFCPMCGKQQ